MSVVLPAPFGPMMPTRSPARRIVSKPSISTRSSYAFRMPCRLSTVRPRRAVSGACSVMSPVCFDAYARLSFSSDRARSMRARDLPVRAGGERRAHSSSCSTSRRRFASTVACHSARAACASRYSV
jgi:hypothetical protein